MVRANEGLREATISARVVRGAPPSRLDGPVAYREWGRKGPPRWVAWGVIAVLACVILGLLVAH
jgi:hypothetical protein